MVREAVQMDLLEAGASSVRTASTRVQRERQELELAVRRGTLLDAGDVELTWSQYISAARARLLALPAVAAVRVVGMTVSSAAEELRVLVFDALRELAAYDLDAFTEVDPERFESKPAIERQGAGAAGAAADQDDRSTPSPGAGSAPDHSTSPLNPSSPAGAPGRVAGPGARRRRAAGPAGGDAHSSPAGAPPRPRREVEAVDCD